MTLRETGSILVSAPRDEVYALLRARMESEPGLRTMTAERIESSRRTFVLREAPGGTHVVMARTENRPATHGQREDLRLAVSEELLALQKLIAPRA